MLDEDFLVVSLLEYGSTLKQTQSTTSENLFHSDNFANQLCINDPFAFVLGCLAAQGIRADKIWEFPYKLYKRSNSLKHLNIRKIYWEILEKGRQSLFKELVNCIGGEKRCSLFKGEKAIHRFVETMANYVVDLIYTTGHIYDGDISKIWTIDNDAKNIQKRFLELKGFGPKKAAMATELLHSFLGLSIINLEETNVAADIHVQRVLYRYGIIKKMNATLAIQAAKNSYPQEPAKLDYPLWTIGRTYCKSKNPKCNKCPLEKQCQKNI